MKIGDYVRTEDGHIDKIVKIADEMKSGRTIKVQIGEKDIIGGYEDFVDWFSPSHFIKSSPNIIDLIEVGDYVNGCKIIELATNADGKVLYLETDITEFDNVYACGNINIYEKEIRSIVTKEQFESMEYKVGE